MTIRVVVAIIAIPAFLVALAGGAWLAWNLALAGPGGCPTALVQGTLVEDGGTLAVATEWSPDPVAILWPFGYAVERRDGELALTRVFQVVARAGDEVSIGGADGGGGSFRGCGPISLGLLDPPEPTLEPRATFIVMATSAQPCLIPPSGCSYTVRLTAPSGETSEADVRGRPVVRPEGQRREGRAPDRRACRRSSLRARTDSTSRRPRTATW